jgi:hypothetical protein
MATHQAPVIAYNNDFRLMMLMCRQERPAVAAGD